MSFFRSKIKCNYTKRSKINLEHIEKNYKNFRLPEPFYAPPRALGRAGLVWPSHTGGIKLSRVPMLSQVLYTRAFRMALLGTLDQLDLVNLTDWLCCRSATLEQNRFGLAHHGLASSVRSIALSIAFYSGRFLSQIRSNPILTFQKVIRFVFKSG